MLRFIKKHKLVMIVLALILCCIAVSTIDVEAASVVTSQEQGFINKNGLQFSGRGKTIKGELLVLQGTKNSSGEMKISVADITKQMIWDGKNIVSANLIEDTLFEDASSTPKTITSAKTNVSLGSANEKHIATLTVQMYDINTILEVKVILVKNNPPEINAPHYIVSSGEKDAFDKAMTETPSNKSAQLEYALMKELQVYDIENIITQDNYMDFTTLEYNGAAFNSKTFSKGRTYVLTATVTDNNTTASTPYYVTFLDDEVKEEGEKVFVGVRPITEDFYPYHRNDIKKDGNKYFAKMEDNALYYIDKDGEFLLTPRGDKYPVDACLTVRIKKGAGGIYEITPMSKWIVNAECANLLVSCFENTGDNFIEKWSFNSDMVMQIKSNYATKETDGIDKNFTSSYGNNNKYKTLGNKQPNETNRSTKYTPIKAGAQETNLQWNLSNGVLYIECKPTISVTSSHGFKIPSYDATTGETAPWAGSYYHTVILDDRIEAIGNSAFEGASISNPIKIPLNCTHIGNNAFKDCRTMPGGINLQNVYSIGEGAFENCVGLNDSLIIGNGVSKIGARAFKNCAFTGGLNIPNSVTEIGQEAFANCCFFTGKLTISYNVKKIENGTFRNCSGLSGEIAIPAKVTAIGDYAFAGCTGFNQACMLGENLETIGRYAFANCSNLKGDATGVLTLPTKLKSIDAYAFYNCSSIANTLVINAKLTSIGDFAFALCDSITKIDNRAEPKGAEILMGTSIFYVKTPRIIYVQRETFPDNSTTNFHTYDYTQSNRKR